MNRNDLILKAQQASQKLKSERFPKWEDSELVCWNGNKYIPIKYILWFDCGTPKHSFVLKDPEAFNSFVDARIEEISEVSE